MEGRGRKGYEKNQNKGLEKRSQDQVGMEESNKVSVYPIRQYS